MNNLIQQLKDNEKPFGLMSEEMQEKARDIPKEYFDVYEANFSDAVWTRCAKGSGKHCIYQAYRLRADYENEPEIVECEIKPNSDGELRYNYRGDSDIWCPFEDAFADPDFIGFKFGGIKQIINKEVGYSHNDIDILPFVNYDDLKSGRYKVLHATHVLFRRQE